jgi:hypothetical protein
MCGYLSVFACVCGLRECTLCLPPNLWGQIAKVVGEGYWLFMACHQQLQLAIMFLPTQLQLFGYFDDMFSN